MWLEILERGNNSEKMCPRGRFLRRKEKLQISFKPGLGSPRMPLMMPSINSNNHRVMPHSSGGKWNSVSRCEWGRARIQWGKALWGYLCRRLIIVCPLITTIYVNLVLSISPKVLSLPLSLSVEVEMFTMSSLLTCSCLSEWGSSVVIHLGPWGSLSTGSLVLYVISPPG